MSGRLSFRDRRRLEGESGPLVSKDGYAADGWPPLPGWYVWTKRRGQWIIACRADDPNQAMRRWHRLTWDQPCKPLLLPGGVTPQEYKRDRRSKPR